MIMGFDGIASLKAARDGVAPMPDGVGARLRRIYQVAYRVPPTNATATAQTALQRSRLQPGLVRRTQRDTRSIVSMGNGDLRDRLHQTFFPSPYDHQIHDWGRDPASDFLEPLSTGSVGGESYSGGGMLSLGGYSIAEINGLARAEGLGGRGSWWNLWAETETQDFPRGASWVTKYEGGTFYVQDPGGRNWTARRDEFTPHSEEMVGDSGYVVAAHRGGKEVFIPQNLAITSGLLPPAQTEREKEQKRASGGNGTPPLVDVPWLDSAGVWLRANSTLVGVAAAAGVVLLLWAGSRR